MRLFGKQLFENKHKYDFELYDFAQHGLIRGNNEIFDFVAVENIVDGSKPKKSKKQPKGVEITPKAVYELESLNDTTYQLICDDDYIDKHIKSLKKKMELVPQKKRKVQDRNVIEIEDSYGGGKYGYLEMESLVERLENRRFYNEHKKFFDQFPYTTSALINEVLTNHSNLRSKRVEEFIPDLPDDAVDIMTEYTDKVKFICGKTPVYYIIADRKDFGEKDKKRDPILLVQSPFALAWQILGAWDEEMVYLGDL